MGHYIDEQGNSVPVSTGPKGIAAGKVLDVKQPTPKTGQLDVVHPTQTTAAPAAVGNAVHAAGGTSAGAEPTSMEASPPSTAVAGNAAGASSAVAESVPAAPVVEDAKLPASNVAAINATTDLAATDIGTSICAANCVSMLTTSNILALMPLTSFPVRAIGVVSFTAKIDMRYSSPLFCTHH